MKVEIVRAWPRRFERIEVELGQGACVGDALGAAGIGAADMACAVFGVVARADTPLHDGDRIELLRPLQMDPKEARRRRASRASGQPER